MQILTSFNKTITISFLLIGSLSGEPIGTISEQKGFAGLQRDGETSVISASEFPDVLMYDTAQTVNGRMKIQFKGDEQLDLTEHTKVWIDEVYYDPDPSKSKMAIRMAQGTARFASGFGGKIKKSNIKVSTPTAQIAVVGTDFTTTIDEIGRSLVILLPDKFGNPSGKIIVSNAGGSVTLEEAYQATMVSTYDDSPTKPVTVSGIDASMIDNMFIVNPPQEIQQQQDERQTENNSNNILTADFLEFNDLEKDYLDENELEYTELDRDLLDVDFLQDLLEIIEEVDMLDRKKSKGGFSNVDIAGTLPGFDKDTQYQTIVEDTGNIWFYRQVTGIISIRLTSDANASINTITDEKESIITVGDGQSVNIIIRQTN